MIPPLALIPDRSWAVRARFVVAIGGPAFFWLWLAGGIPFYLAVTALAAWDAHRAGPTTRWEDRLLAYYVFFVCGVGGVWNAIGHSVLADEVARWIGWPTGSPFQLELAAAHAGWALVALATPWLHRHVVEMVVVSKAVFLLGAAAVHVADLLAVGNLSPGNAGFTVLILGDITVPILTLVVWTRTVRRDNATTRPGRRSETAFPTVP